MTIISISRKNVQMMHTLKIKSHTGANFVDTGSSEICREENLRWQQ